MEKIPIFFIVSATYKADDGVIRGFKISYSLDEIYTGTSGICMGLREEFKGRLLENLLTDPGTERLVTIDPDGEVVHTITRVSEKEYFDYNNKKRK
ncbi:hypothetical protein CMU32_12290 [Elizabethkingia anophelis]|nr:hypothetical protein [Elizabethkingia anophelis]